MNTLMIKNILEVLINFHPFRRGRRAHPDRPLAQSRRARAGSFQSGSFDNYLQSSFFSGSREIGNTVKIFSLSRDVIGTHIVPRSITFDFLPVEFYIVNESNYVDETLPSGRYILEEV